MCFGGSLGRIFSVSVPYTEPSHQSFFSATWHELPWLHYMSTRVMRGCKFFQNLKNKYLREPKFSLLIRDIYIKMKEVLCWLYLCNYEIKWMYALSTESSEVMRTPPNFLQTCDRHVMKVCLQILLILTWQYISLLNVAQVTCIMPSTFDIKAHNTFKIRPLKLLTWIFFFYFTSMPEPKCTH